MQCATLNKQANANLLPGCGNKRAIRNFMHIMKHRFMQTEYYYQREDVTYGLSRQQFTSRIVSVLAGMKGYFR